MDEGRLGAVRRQQDHHRKSTIVMNDIINYQQNVYTCYLKRERQNIESKLRAQEVFLKKSIVRNSFLLQCMETRKQKVAERSPEKLILGRYGGRPLHAFSRDVEACISWMHPRLRRLRKVEKAKRTGLKLGAIMDFNTLPQRIDAILQKPQNSPNDDSQEPDQSGDITSSSHRHPPPGKHRHPKNILRPHNGIFPSRGLVLRDPLPMLPSSINTTTADFEHNNNKSITKTVLDGDVTATNNNNNMSQSKSSGNIDILKLSSTDDGDNDETVCVETNSGYIGKHKNEPVGVVLKEKVSTSYNKSDGKPEKKSKSMPTTETTTRGKDEDLKAMTGKVMTPPPLVRRPTLVLPPITSTKEMMKKHGFDDVIQKEHGVDDVKHKGRDTQRNIMN